MVAPFGVTLMTWESRKDATDESLNEAARAVTPVAVCSTVVPDVDHFSSSPLFRP